MTISLRPARSTDAGKLGEMITQAMQSRPWKPLLHTGAEDIAHTGKLIDRDWVTVAVMNDRVCGFIAREQEEVHALFVATDSQSNGVGSALLRDAMTRSDTLVLWTFQANTGAQRFYDRHGFTEIERGDGSANEEGLPDIRLRWTSKLEPSQEKKPASSQDAAKTQKEDEHG